VRSSIKTSDRLTAQGGQAFTASWTWVSAGTPSQRHAQRVQPGQFAAADELADDDRIEQRVERLGIAAVEGVDVPGDHRAPRSLIS
jgi:hypothetical protein